MSGWKPWGSFAYEKVFYAVMVDGRERKCWPNAGGLHFAEGKEGWISPERAKGMLARKIAEEDDDGER